MTSHERDCPSISVEIKRKRVVGIQQEETSLQKIEEIL